MESPEQVSAAELPVYRHTQRAPLLWLAAPLWLTEAFVPVLVPMPREADFIVWGSAIILMLVSWQFSALTIEGQAEALQVWFGSVRALGVRVPYAEITTFAAEKTTWLDGWGLHYTRTGWLFNLWGWDCVRISTSKRNLRLGTDDVDGLLAFLSERTALRT